MIAARSQEMIKIIPAPIHDCWGFINEKTVLCKESLKMVSGSFYLPKDNELKPKGEDAHFTCADKQTIGIADGVGGWAKYGVDAGEYARELMMNSETALHQEPKGAVDPKRVLSQAFTHTKLNGSSTACIITITGNTLRAANVDDSGFIIIRKERVVYRSPVQQRSFNCPFQLGRAKDGPGVAQVLQVALEADDVVVAGTDGLFDNMHLYEILDSVSRGRNQGSDPQSIACTIAELALYNSFDRFADTPFSEAAQRSGYKNAKGGKIDDITAIVAYIL